MIEISNLINLSRLSSLCNSLFLLIYSGLAPSTTRSNCEALGALPQHQRRPQQHDLELQPRPHGDPLPPMRGEAGRASVPPQHLPRKVPRATRHHNDRHGGEVRRELEVGKSTISRRALPALPRLLQQL